MSAYVDRLPDSTLAYDTNRLSRSFAGDLRYQRWLAGAYIKEDAVGPNASSPGCCLCF
jgi:hypothetical protein